MAIQPIPDISTVKPSTPPDFEALPYRLAYVIDGVVVFVLNTDGRTAAIITSNPTIVQVDPESYVAEGFLYDGQKFTLPTSK